MKTTRYCFTLFLCLTVSAFFQGRSEDEPARDQKIMVALLLDTSNSMDGLIDQAKSQLWRIVNQLASAKCSDGARPAIQIALYEYGNDGLSARQGYIRQVAPLTTDLDLISEKLFSLRTNGGSEFCGQVINTSVSQLAWSSDATDLKMIFIAGNEPFSQGEIAFRTACGLARQKDIVVNTIYCGNYDSGIQEEWKTGADLTNGTYMSIEQDRKTVFIPTPYDAQIDALNSRLNDTYIYYGARGRASKENQLKQDSNSAGISSSNKVERAIAKSSYAYDNSSWDIVDARTKDKEVLKKLSDDQLPEELKGMTTDQRKAYIDKKSAERTTVQAQIGDLSKKREAYLREHKPKEASNDLDDAMLRSIRSRATSKKIEL